VKILFFIFIAFCIFVVINYIRKILEQQKAKKREKRYWLKIEPMYRDCKKYPPDWEIRRAFVYFRENGLCEKCLKVSGTINTTQSEFWLNPHVHREYSRFVRGSNVHHKKHISKGGNHHLENLQLLCEDCHDHEHPKKGLKQALQRSRAINNHAFSYQAKVKTARKEWSCVFCQASIMSGSKYFGDKYAKICLECYEKYKKSIRRH